MQCKLYEYDNHEIQLTFKRCEVNNYAMKLISRR